MIDVTKPLVEDRTGWPVRYVGLGVPDWPIVAVCCAVLGGECIRQYSASGKCRDGTSNISNPAEPEDWS